MENLVDKITYLQNTFNSILVLAGQATVCVATLVRAITYARESNMEKIGSCVISGIIITIIIGIIPSVMKSFM